MTDVQRGEGGGKRGGRLLRVWTRDFDEEIERKGHIMLMLCKMKKQQDSQPSECGGMKAGGIFKYDANVWDPCMGGTAG